MSEKKNNSNEKPRFLKFILKCTAVNEVFSNVPQGTMVPSLVLTILALLLGNISNLLGIVINLDFMITFLLIYIIFLEMQVLALMLYIIARGVLRTYFLGDVINTISSFGIYIFFFLFMLAIILQILNPLYIGLIIISMAIMCCIFWVQSLHPLIKSFKILHESWHHCIEYGSFPNCTNCKLK